MRGGAGALSRTPRRTRTVAMTATNLAVRTHPGLPLPFLEDPEEVILCLFASSMSGIRSTTCLPQRGPVEERPVWSGGG